MRRSLIVPAPLKTGDKMVILSPSGATNHENVHEAARVLEEHGLRVSVMPHALGRNGSYSGSYSERMGDLTDALNDPEVKAIMCSRGGTGRCICLKRLTSCHCVRMPNG